MSQVVRLYCKYLVQNNTGKTIILLSMALIEAAGAAWITIGNELVIGVLLTLIFAF